MTFYTEAYQNWNGEFPMYPNVNVELTHDELTNTDLVYSDNASTIMLKVKTAIENAGLPVDVWNNFLDEGSSEDYEHFLDTCRSIVSVS